MGYDDVDCKDAESFFHQGDAPALHHLVLKKAWVSRDYIRQKLLKFK